MHYFAVLGIKESRTDGRFNNISLKCERFKAVSLVIHGKPCGEYTNNTFAKDHFRLTLRHWRIVLAEIFFWHNWTKKHNVSEEHCHGIISKFSHFLEHKFITFSKYGVFLQCVFALR